MFLKRKNTEREVTAEQKDNKNNAVIQGLLLKYARETKYVFFGKEGDLTEVRGDPTEADVVLQGIETMDPLRLF